MTAFGRAGCELVECEIKSVNHRYLELGFRLPEVLRDLERRLRELAAGRLRRGKVEATLRLNGGSAALRVDSAMVEQLLAAVESIRGQTRTTLAAVSPLDLMRFPGVMADDDGDVHRLKAAALRCFGTALDDLVSHRASEGSTLRGLLLERLTDVERVTARLRDLAASHGDHLWGRLRERVQAVAAGIAPERLEQEVVMLVQKADVAEELDRIAIHVAEARLSLGRDEPCGRRLDFLLQELNREANTLASKSIMPEAARVSVDLKVTIEQMREQVQNVE